MYYPFNPYFRAYPYTYPYRRLYPYGYSYPYHNYGYNILNSQISSVNQSLYNAGYMNGVTQSSIVNQIGPFGGYY
jgi:hypothetical protein